MLKTTTTDASAKKAGAAVESQGRKAMLTTIIIILIPTIAGAIGQMMLKVGMSQMGTLNLSIAELPSIAMRIALNPMVIFGLAIYMGGVFFWLIGLNKLDLSYLYPFASLGYVLIAVASWAILHEQIPTGRWIGLAVICVGVAIAARG